MLQRYNFFTYFKIYIYKKIHKKLLLPYTPSSRSFGIEKVINKRQTPKKLKNLWSQLLKT